MKKIAVALLVLGAAVGARVLGAQIRAESGSETVGYIAGHVYADDTQKPVRFCSINLINVGREGRGMRGGPMGALSNSTTVNGTFLLAVQPGEYYVTASQPGYVQVVPPSSGTNDAAPPAGTMVHVFVQANQTSQADITLQRGGTVSGRLIYDDGTPAVGITATAIPVGTNVSTSGSNRSHTLQARSDDQGNYRIPGVPDGKYTVRVQPALGYGFSGNAVGGVRSVQFPTYLGNTLLITQATAFELHTGDDRSGSDITIPVTNLHSLSGVVQADNGGRGLSGMLVTLSLKDPNVPPGAVMPATTSFNTYTMTDGSFKFDGVPDSDYLLSAPGGTEGAPGGQGRRMQTNNSISYKSAQISATVQNGDSTANVLSLQSN